MLRHAFLSLTATCTILLVAANMAAVPAPGRLSFCQYIERIGIEHQRCARDRAVREEHGADELTDQPPDKQPGRAQLATRASGAGAARALRPAVAAVWRGAIGASSVVAQPRQLLELQIARIGEEKQFENGSNNAEEANRNVIYSTSKKTFYNIKKLANRVQMNNAEISKDRKYDVPQMEVEGLNYKRRLDIQVKPLKKVYISVIAEYDKIKESNAGALTEQGIVKSSTTNNEQRRLQFEKQTITAGRVFAFDKEFQTTKDQKKSDKKDTENGDDGREILAKSKKEFSSMKYTRYNIAYNSETHHEQQDDKVWSRTERPTYQVLSKIPPETGIPVAQTSSGVHKRVHIASPYNHNGRKKPAPSATHRLQDEQRVQLLIIKLKRMRCTNQRLRLSIKFLEQMIRSKHTKHGDEEHAGKDNKINTDTHQPSRHEHVGSNTEDKCRASKLSFVMRQQTAEKLNLSSQITGKKMIKMFKVVSPNGKLMVVGLKAHMLRLIQLQHKPSTVNRNYGLVDINRLAMNEGVEVYQQRPRHAISNANDPLALKKRAAPRAFITVTKRLLSGFFWLQRTRHQASPLTSSAY